MLKPVWLWIKQAAARAGAYFKTNHEAINASAATVQALAVVTAGIWFGFVFYYSEKIKPTLPDTFLNPQLRLSIVGTEVEPSGAEFHVIRADLEMENKSGQKLDLLSSILLVNADQPSAEPVAFKASDVERSLNMDRGSRGRFRSGLELTRLVYVANEFSGWSVDVGERGLHSRLFRVPVGEFSQIEANWYTLAGPRLKGVEVVHVVVPHEKFDFTVVSCACKGDCPRPPKLSASSADSQECLAPWHEFESSGAREVFGFKDKSGKSTATAFLALPSKLVSAPSAQR